MTNENICRSYSNQVISFKCLSVSFKCVSFSNQAMNNISSVNRLYKMDKFCQLQVLSAYQVKGLSTT